MCCPCAAGLTEQHVVNGEGGLSGTCATGTLFALCPCCFCCHFGGVIGMAREQYGIVPGSNDCLYALCCFPFAICQVRTREPIACRHQTATCRCRPAGMARSQVSTGHAGRRRTVPRRAEPQHHDIATPRCSVAARVALLVPPLPLLLRIRNFVDAIIDWIEYAVPSCPSAGTGAVFHSGSSFSDFPFP